MPVIPEEESTMEEFVNWDNADPAVGAGFDLDPMPGISSPSADDMVLVFENIDGDDFSFWALEHYANSAVPVLDQGNAEGKDAEEEMPLGALFAPDAACLRCQRGGYECKRIREGKYKGYCTSCVALRHECSFGLASRSPSGPAQSATFPANPWPTLGDHPNSIPHEETHCEVHQSTSTSDLLGLTITADEPNPTISPTTAPKIGARFSRESVKILKNWLSTHGRHPYPTDEEKESLQRLTGLNKTQITNWLANARRRGKVHPPRSTSPHVRSWAGAIDIPQRRGTPSPLDIPRRATPIEDMNPLQRWANSPPENEPASVTDIARAITSSSSAISSGLNSPFSINYTEDGSGRSLCNASSASSINTSQSSGGNSFGSAYSRASTRGSFGSFGSFQRGRRRRRRRAALKRTEDGQHTSLATPLKTFQCTFCTETFRTKHDWQRHEKSLHLSLERWVCAPSGPVALNPDTKQISCVFCGEANPDTAHIDSHNYSACQERSLADRTFYRKDHLRQHLKLVHNVKFASWSMEPWKVVTPEIRSRCGFCGIVMDTWTIRVDHLAEHFKTGNTMADWKGDWGFEAPVLEMVENSIPPYLIHDERNSPLPFTAQLISPETPRYAYCLMKYELVHWLLNQADKGHIPTDEEMHVEACRIVFASEVTSKHPSSPANKSWLRDLLMKSSETRALQAQMSPIRTAAESRMAVPKINGKDNLFDDCPLERQLNEFVKARQLLGLTAMDSELQTEACHIIGRLEESSNSPSDVVANFFIRLISGSTSWLADFRQRSQLPRSEEIADESQRSKDPMSIDFTVHNYSRLENELAAYAKAQVAMGVVPDDSSLQKQARLIIYEFDDGWNQTAADNAQWLTAFKTRHMSQSGPDSHNLSSHSPITLESLQQSVSSAFTPASTAALFDSLMAPGPVTAAGGATPMASMASMTPSTLIKTSPYFLNDANCYRRLEKELTRYVNATMSPNNPNCHVPTDQELQHQARWILYDDDDPWNQTAADNAEWLQRFKRDAGILPADAGPGLPDGNSWSILQGGTGFAPPYCFPKAQMEPFNENVQIPLRENAKSFEAESTTANKFLQNFTSRYPAPASVFCSRELETGLVAFVESEVAQPGGQFPADDVLKAKAKAILGLETTAADDDVLLGKFKDMVRAKIMGEQPAIQDQIIQELPMDLGLNLTQTEMDEILQDMNFELGEGLDLAGMNNDVTGI